MTYRAAWGLDTAMKNLVWAPVLLKRQLRFWDPARLIRVTCSRLLQPGLEP